MDYLEQLENKTIYIMREAYHHYRNLSMLWSMGKDSTTMLWLARKAFFGKIPFPVLHIDTTYKFKEIYDFRDHYAKEWDLDLKIAKNDKAIEEGMGPGEGTKIDCCNALKTVALKQAVAKEGFEALLLGIRRDEHGIRAKERVFSPRNMEFKWNYEDQPAELWDLYKSKKESELHIRVHPMLHWTEYDIWAYTEKENIPVIDLYFAREGKRYRSIGCETCCSPVESKANTVKKVVKELLTTDEAERSGRAQDKEDSYTMQKLRSLGYM